MKPIAVSRRRSLSSKPILVGTVHHVSAQLSSSDVPQSSLESAVHSSVEIVSGLEESAFEGRQLDTSTMQSQEVYFLRQLDASALIDFQSATVLDSSTAKGYDPQLAKQLDSSSAVAITPVFLISLERSQATSHDPQLAKQLDFSTGGGVAPVELRQRDSSTIS